MHRKTAALHDWVQNEYFTDQQQFQVLEGFGGRCGEVKLDGEETSAAEMDKVLI